MNYGTGGVVVDADSVVGKGLEGTNPRRVPRDPCVDNNKNNKNK
jgi:hypothetical protein